MRYMHLFENSDYNVARKQLEKLSPDAAWALENWPNWGWENSLLENAFKHNAPIAQEIWNAGQSIRDNIRSRVGDKITLYRGLKKYSRDVQGKNTDDFLLDGRVLYSWTSSEKKARYFAGQEYYEDDYDLENPEIFISDKECKHAINKFKKSGYAKIRHMIYKKLKNNPDYYFRFNTLNRFSSDPKHIQNFKNDIETFTSNRNREFRRMYDIPGKVLKKSIPVDSIVWVLMYAKENEYIVKGHKE